MAEKSKPKFVAVEAAKVDTSNRAAMAELAKRAMTTSLQTQGALKPAKR